MLTPEKSITVDFERPITLRLQTSLFESFDAKIILNLNYLKITHSGLPFNEMKVSSINFSLDCVRKCLELITEPQASVRNLLHLEQYLRFVILLRYKYLYLRFLRLPPCGILWICPHFDQNILISQHLSFYPINWFLDKSANRMPLITYWVWVHWKMLSNWDSGKVNLII